MTLLVQAKRDALSCRSSMAMTGALASYDIPEQNIDRGMPAWLSRCIAEAAKHLDEAPFLQLLLSLKSNSFQHHSVTPAVVQVHFRFTYWTSKNVSFAFQPDLFINSISVSE